VHALLYSNAQVGLTRSIGSLLDIGLLGSLRLMLGYSVLPTQFELSALQITDITSIDTN